MSGITKSTILYSTNQGATYKSKDVIELVIPPSLGSIITTSSYLHFNIRMSGLLKKSLSSAAGVGGLFENITVLSGDGQTVIETLDSYGIQQALYYYYSKIEGNSLVNLHEGKPNTMLFEYGAGNQYCQGQAVKPEEAHKNLEVVFPLYLVGCLSPARKAFPVVATNGLILRFNLATADKACQVISTPVYKGSSGGQPIKNSYGKLGGGYEYHFAVDSNDTDKVLVLNSGDKVPSTFADTDFCLLPAQSGFSHPFLIGQTVYVGNGEVEPEVGDCKIVNIEVDSTTGELSLTLDKTIPTDTGRSLRIIPFPEVENYEISNFTFVVSYTIPDPKVIKKIESSVKSGKFFIDINTYTDYAVNISNQSLVNSLYIKSVNARSKAIISVPIKASSEAIVEDSYTPDTQGVSNYNYFLFGVNVPNRNVNVKPFQLTDADPSTGRWSAEGIKEMEHALTASGFPVNTLRDPWNMFFIGRKLAKSPYTQNLNQEGDIRLNVNYESVAPTLMHNFVNHIRRIMVKGNSIEMAL